MFSKYSFVIASSVFSCNQLFKKKSFLDNNNNNNNEIIAVYLTPTSQESVEKYCKSIGLPNHTSKYVVIKNEADQEDSYIYQPLYGERAAFRMKGIIKTENGKISGSGLISTIVGEVMDDTFDSSIVIVNKNDLESTKFSYDTESIDLPTRFNHSVDVKNKKKWSGNINSNYKDYPSIRGNYKSFDWNNQLLIDGYICSSKFVDNKGKCTFDRGKDMVQEPKLIKDISSKSRTRASIDKEMNQKQEKKVNAAKPKIDVEEEEEDSKNSECPVCKYMRSGPCKEEFDSWDDCVQSMDDKDDLSKCFKKTVGMMECMRKYEYYDIMTVGTNEKMNQMKEMEKEKE
jgi:hypothetical protein